MIERIESNPQKWLIYSLIAPFIIPAIAGIITGEPWAVFFYLNIFLWMFNAIFSLGLLRQVTMTLELAHAFALLGGVPLLGIAIIIYWLYWRKMKNRWLGFFFACVSGLLAIELIGFMIVLLFGVGATRPGY